MSRRGSRPCGAAWAHGPGRRKWPRPSSRCATTPPARGPNCWRRSSPTARTRRPIASRPWRAGLDSLRLLRDPRALPLAVGALADRETQLPALACIAELGGPAQGEAVADLAERSPTAEILPLAARILSDWGRRPALSPAERL